MAAQAGAVFAVIYNNDAGTSGCPGGDTLCPMGGTDFVPIPACVHRGNGRRESLRASLPPTTATWRKSSCAALNYAFDVTNTLVCEQIGVSLQTDYPLRGNLRVTLVSPMGTRSVLQCYNTDTNAGPANWTYYSTHHFFESSAGTWTLTVADEGIGTTGSVLGASLIIYGVPITDTDHDGLDDNWEMKYFGTLAYGPKDNPAHDGYNNAFKQVLQSNPLVAENPFNVNLSLLEYQPCPFELARQRQLYLSALGRDQCLGAHTDDKCAGHFSRDRGFCAVCRHFAAVLPGPGRFKSLISNY